MNTTFTMRTAYVSALLTGLVGLVGCGKSLKDYKPNAQEVAVLKKELAASRGATGDAAKAETPAAEPTGWGTLKGSFTLVGGAPPRTPLDINKDTAVCSAGGPILSEEIVVSPDGGIQNIVVFVSQKLSGDEPWTHASAKLGKTDPVQFDQKNCVFTTHLLALQSTQPIRLTNSDSVGHNANLAANSNARFDQTIAGGGEALYQPKAEEREPFPVSCAIHPWMKAWVITRNNSYFAVTKPDGSFAIENLPAGVDLEFRVWQERSKWVSRAKVNGDAAKWPSGKFKVQVKPGDVTEMKVELDASLFK